MGIYRLAIDNCLSIKHLDLRFSEGNFFLGENETGKTNIQTCVRYFYANLTRDAADTTLFDKQNTFSKELSITLWFDMTAVYIRSKNRLNKDASRYASFYSAVCSLPYDKQGDRYIVKLTLNQTDKRVRWLIGSGPKKAYTKDKAYAIRKLIGSIFPLFYVDCRSIQLHDWDELWKSIGQLVSINVHEYKQLAKNLPDYISSEDGKTEYLTEVKALKKLLETSQLKLHSFDLSDYRKIIAKLGLQGDTFYYKETPLTYRSDGQNSYNYLFCLLQVIALIAKRKTRTPVLLVDEPELGWHTKQIDEFSRKLEALPQTAFYIANTHSSRLVKNMLLLENKGLRFFQCTSKNYYTTVNALVTLADEEAKVKARASDDQINAFFSKMILVVEGDTEFELFRSESLHKVFPELDAIDVFRGGSNAPELAVVNPVKRGTKLPYVTLWDMDKVLDVQWPAVPPLSESEKALVEDPAHTQTVRNALKNALRDEKALAQQKANIEAGRFRFKFKATVIPATFDENWEKYPPKTPKRRGKPEWQDPRVLLYGEKRYKRLLLTKKIERQAALEHRFSTLWGRAATPAWNALLEDLQQFANAYNVYLWPTTVEGALVCEGSSGAVKTYFKAQLGDRLNQLLEGEDVPEVTALRLVAQGHLDCLVRRKDFLNCTEDKPFHKTLMQCKVPKTGWVSKFLDYYFGHWLHSAYKGTADTSGRWKTDGEFLQFCRGRFETDFPDLYGFLQYCFAKLPS